MEGSGTASSDSCRKERLHWPAPGESSSDHRAKHCRLLSIEAPNSRLSRLVSGPASFFRRSSHLGRPIGCCDVPHQRHRRHCWCRLRQYESHRFRFRMLIQLNGGGRLRLQTQYQRTVIAYQVNKSDLCSFRKGDCMFHRRAALLAALWRS